MLAIAYLFSLASALQLDFDVYRGNSIHDLRQSNRPLFKRDSVLVTLENEQTWYLIDLEVGSNKNKVQVQIDTGSSDLWMPTSDVICYEIADQLGDAFIYPTTTSTGLPTQGVPTTDTCTSYGSFNTGDSSSFHDNGTQFEIQYQDTTFAAGVWGTDDIVIGNSTVQDLSFGVVTSASSGMGVIGVGLQLLEATVDSINGPVYDNLPIKLKEQGYISKVAYSLYLNSLEASSGTLLFGAVDHAKYSGNLTTVPVLNGEVEYGVDAYLDLNIALDGISLVNGDQTTSISTTRYPALLDSGTTLSYVPSDLASLIAETLGGQQDDYGDYLFPCNVGDSYQLEFDFSGAKIQVPFVNFLVETAGFRSTCVLGIQPQSDPMIVLGDNFLSSAYVVYDLEDLQISLAQVNYSNDSNIEDIVSTVPSAASAPGYSSTLIGNELENRPTVTLSLTTGASNTVLKTSGSELGTGTASLTAGGSGGSGASKTASGSTNSGSSTSRPTSQSTSHSTSQSSSQATSSRANGANVNFASKYTWMSIFSIILGSLM